MPKKNLLFAILFTVLVLAAVWIGYLLGTRGDETNRQNAAALEQRLASLEKLEARFANLEEQIRRPGASASPRAGASGAEAAAAEEAANDGQRAPQDRLASLETEMQELAERVEGLSDDPISRGYAFLASKFPD